MADGKAIRRQLKADTGYNARQVSVRVHNYSMGCTVYFKVRDAAVDYGKVKDWVARNVEKIDVCEITNEILCGGNTFTHVEATDEVVAAWAAPIVNQVREAVARLADSTSHGEGVEGTDLIVWKDEYTNGHYLSRKSDLNGWRTRYWDASDCEGMAADAYRDHGAALLTK